MFSSTKVDDLRVREREEKGTTNSEPGSSADLGAFVRQ